MVFGWDISTSIIGVTILDNDHRFIDSKYWDLRKMTDCSLLDKLEETEPWLKDVLTQFKGDGHFCHYVEDRLGNFAAGRTMLQALMKLAAFNLALSYMIYKTSQMLPGSQSVSITHIHPSTVKSLMKKEGLLIGKGDDKKKVTLEFVTKKIPHFPVEMNRNQKPQPWCYDMADSYITARAGLLSRKKGE